jgi:hypothetical protein
MPGQQPPREPPRRGRAAHPTSTSSPPAGTPPKHLVELAHTVTEMRKVCHAYGRGVGARRGIEF